MRPTFPLDTSDFNCLLQQSLSAWKQQTKQSIQPADFSYTVLEMQAFLVDMLNYYMESKHADYEESYARLLGNQPILPILNDDCERASIMGKGMLFRCTCKVFQKLNAYACIKAKTANSILHLETRQPQFLSTNQILAVFYEDACGIERIESLLRDVEGSFMLKEDIVDCQFHILLAQELEMHQEISFYFLLDDEKRNPFDKLPFRLATWKFEAYTLHGWQTLEVRDETEGFLHSGYIYITCKKMMLPVLLYQEYGYWIRLTGSNFHYDTLPCFQSIWLNVITLYPLHTLAKTITIKKEKMPLFIISKECPQIKLWKQQEDKGWQPIAYHCKAYQNGWLIQPTEVASSYRLLWQTEDISKIERMMSGITAQKTIFPSLERLRIAVQGKDGLYQDYQICTDGMVNEDGYGCMLQGTTLCFGDGKDFLVPPRNKQGLLLWDCVLEDERYTQLAAKEVQFSKDNFRGILALPYEKNKKKKTKKGDLYQQKDIQAYVKNLAGTAFERVEVTPTYKVLGKGITGWNVYCAGFGKTGIIKQDELAYVASCLHDHLPIYTICEVASLQKRYIQLTIQLQAFAASGQNQLNLIKAIENICTKCLIENGGLTETLILNQLLQHPNIQRVFHIKIVLDGCEIFQIQCHTGEWYIQKPPQLVWE